MPNRPQQAYSTNRGPRGQGSASRREAMRQAERQALRARLDVGDDIVSMRTLRLLANLAQRVADLERELALHVIKEA